MKFFKKTSVHALTALVLTISPMLADARLDCNENPSAPICGGDGETPRPRDVPVPPSPPPACPVGFATCLPGLVWRGAFPGDIACVSPATRDEAQLDNSLATTRKSPTGGVYGPDTCNPGFVWREASPNDHVCVPPPTRGQAAFDNSQIEARRDLSCSTVCGVGWPGLLTLDPQTIATAQTPGRKLIGYSMNNAVDALLIIVDDAPDLRKDQMRVELDIDPFNDFDPDGGVKAEKEILAANWNSPCTSSGRVNSVNAVMQNGGSFCYHLESSNNFRSRCTVTKTMLLEQAQTGALWLRKRAFPGFMYDIEQIDHSIWKAFGGRSVRFIWRRD